MPHFVIECNQSIIERKKPEEVVQAVFDVANASGLFDVQNIKVRLNPYQYYLTANTQADFIHVFARIMEGRTTEMKSILAKKITACLVEMFPNVASVSVDVSDLEKATYCNKRMLS
ncbi:5-carboxymethyl-2-hydroxymuconate Delta-isomerase [Microscilla marina]|uniref:Putative 5-carboxymethyl-2-hydroxymuconate delta-isomerase n=1 Tax=Microscilla marina ATCC 23134 TaxID=313606 RepID=A1ZWR7_MICM2|nr:5-carboxymethyl-2-hydroxymuconate Delta-isomerase [Microscilla marina]EAY25199.1 putative 5-carboxymethyl-2-hydroxymuconate delta-isomerase [Microscilla marina ATCC 23134]